MTPLPTPPAPLGLAWTCHRAGLPPASSGRGRRRARGDSGDSGVATLELTVLFPLVLLLLFGVIQGALYFHGRNVALAAAEQGVRAARADGQPDRAGTASDQARQFLHDTGELDNLTELRIKPQVDTGMVRVTVTARTLSLLPGVPGPRISQTAAGVIERFSHAGDR